MGKRKVLKNQTRSSGFGLKEISNRVREIIKRVGTTSYKEISNEIVNEINEKNTKDEKNIRRRIYDSLNVMKSMKLFKKDKATKKIVWNFFNEKTTNQINTFCDGESNEDGGMFDKISKMKQEINTKKNKLNVLQKQLECLNTILDRNKKNQNSDEGKRIYFPFIIIEFPEKSHNQENKIKVAMNETKTQAHFAFDSSNKLYGDLDAILKIGNNILLRNNKN